MNVSYSFIKLLFISKLTRFHHGKDLIHTDTEFIVQCSDRSLPEAMVTLVPEAWQHDELMSDLKKKLFINEVHLAWIKINFF